MKRRYTILVVAGIVIIILAAALSFNYPREDFSVYNGQWNGDSDLRTLVQNDHPSSVMFGEKDLSGKSSGALLLINPNANIGFSQDDISSIRSFVTAGGSLLIANDFGNANQLLDGLGIGSVVRFNGSLLYDDYNNWAGAALPSISTFSNSNLTSGIRALSFNYATVLDVGTLNGTAAGSPAVSIGNVTVLAKSSPASYLGGSSGAPPDNATRGEKPVLASLTYGDGKIILLSDPSVFINRMIGRGDNEQLFKNVVTNLTSGDPQTPVFFDESHRAQEPLLTVAYLRINSDETLQYVAVLAALGTFAAVLTAMRINRRKRKGIDVGQLRLTDEAMLSDVAKRHPEWSTTQIRKLLRGTRMSKTKR